LHKKGENSGGNYNQYRAHHRDYSRSTLHYIKIKPVQSKKFHTHRAYSPRLLFLHCFRSLNVALAGTGWRRYYLSGQFSLL